jgi:3-deoxy-7-phosphoheptulonate synthase
MSASATDVQIGAVCAALAAAGRCSDTHSGARTLIDVIAPPPADPALQDQVAHMPGVEAVHVASANGALSATTAAGRKAPLHARSRNPHGTSVRVGAGAVRIAPDTFTIIAGPCAVESTEQTLATARAVADRGAAMLRGGAYKPRTSPYAFQGLGLEGLDILDNARDATGLPIVTEAMEPAAIARVAAVADVIQIGSRNMQNTPLLRAAGKAKKPVLLKRGFAATVDELLDAAE